MALNETKGSEKGAVVAYQPVVVPGPTPEGITLMMPVRQGDRAWVAGNRLNVEGGSTTVQKVVTGILGLN